MAIIYVPDDDYNPLEMEPYTLFKNKFFDKVGNLDGEVIKLRIGDHCRKSFAAGFNLDHFYFDGLVLKFLFSKIANGHDEKVVIRHIMEYDYDSSFYEIQQEMAEKMKTCSEYIYIPGAEQFEFTYRLRTTNVQLIYNLVVDEELALDTCFMLISNDITTFSRGW